MAADRQVSPYSGGKIAGIERSCRPGDGSSSLAQNTRNSCETSGLGRIVRRLPKEPFGPVPTWLGRWCQTAIAEAVRISTAITVANSDKGDAAVQRPPLSQQCVDVGLNYPSSRDRFMLSGPVLKDHRLPSAFSCEWWRFPGSRIRNLLDLAAVGVVQATRGSARRGGGSGAPRRHRCRRLAATHA